jgi:NADPH:quinone reductase-like Zn-dependent oxidoreductase
MRAMRIHRYGDASVIREDDVPRPVPGPGEVLIRVAATSFNPSDIGVRRGLLHDVLGLDLPLTLGAEVAGTVVATGERVMARTSGAAAEYVVAPAAIVVAAPAAIPLAHAAAIPVAGLTAWQAVFEHARVAPGQRVLIVGAGGGVGGFAVQLAKHAGATVIATAGPRSAGTVRDLGADRLIDYTATPLSRALDEPVDVVLNLVAAGPRALVPLVRPGGVLVSVTEPVEAPPGSGVKTVHFVARNDPGDLAALAGLVGAGTVRVDISATHSLTDLAAVHRAAESGHTRGKIILLP